MLVVSRATEEALDRLDLQQIVRDAAVAVRV
jgi:hypothetical protein